jgi:hypothetical protein
VEARREKWDVSAGETEDWEVAFWGSEDGIERCRVDVWNGLSEDLGPIELCGGLWRACDAGTLLAAGGSSEDNGRRLSARETPPGARPDIGALWL